MNKNKIDERIHYGEQICLRLNKINTGRDVTISDIYNFEYLSSRQMYWLWFHVLTTITYAVRCRGKGRGYGVNVDINWSNHIKKLFAIKNIEINIFEDRDVSSYVTIVWKDSEQSALTHREILIGEGLSEEEVQESFNDVVLTKKREKELRTVEKELKEFYN